MNNPSAPALSPVLQRLLILACIIIILAGLNAAQSVVVPLLFSTFIAIVCTPPMHALQRIGIPDWLAIAFIIISISLITLLITALAGASVNDFLQQLPAYKQRLSLQFGHLLQLAQHYNVDLSSSALLTYLDPAKALGWFGTLLGSLSNLFTYGLLILITVVFMLFEAASFSQKLNHLLSDANDKALQQIRRFIETINQYMLLKTWMSLATGTAIGLWLWALGVDYPFLWGLLAFLLNYIPTIGSFIAAVPAVLLANLQLGTGIAGLTLAGYVAVNFIVGNMIEPRLMGKGLGLSTLAVFLSLLFWGWMFGTVGMLLSVPLTMMIKLLMETHPGTYWLAVLLGPAQAEQTQAMALNPPFKSPLGGHSEGEK